MTTKAPTPTTVEEHPFYIKVEQTLQCVKERLEEMNPGEDRCDGVLQDPDGNIFYELHINLKNYDKKRANVLKKTKEALLANKKWWDTC